MRRGIWVSAVSAALAFLTAAETAQAQFSISYGRGWRGRGWSMGYGSPFYGGYGWGSGYGYGRGWDGWGSPWYGGRYYSSPGFSISLGTGRYYSPYYGSNFSPIYYSSPSYLYSTPTMFGSTYSGYPGSYVASSDGSPVISRSYYAGPSNLGSTAMVRVEVPTADCKVWFDGTATQQQGHSRVFQSPPLDSGKTYSYTVKASWMDNGKEMTREKTVDVQPGQEATVVFSADRETIPTPPTGKEPPAPLPRDPVKPGGRDNEGRRPPDPNRPLPPE